MEPETSKSKSFTKEETKGLLSIIEESKIINNKKINATNKLKAEEWLRITNRLNTKLGRCRWNPQQVRLKWENLKKNSRKRSTLMRIDQIKTGEPSKNFPPDEILDQVADMLSSAGEASSVSFGGDAEPELMDDSTGQEEYHNISPIPMLMVDENPLSANCASTCKDERCGDNEVPTNSISDGARSGVQRFDGVQRKAKMEDWRHARNKALTEYYIVKKKFIEEKYLNILLENEKLKLENEKLRFENGKLKKSQ